MMDTRLRRELMLRTTICVTLFALAFAQERQEPPRFRVGVDAVRIDAVPVDRNGRVVRDLTVDDFEIRQDGKLQKVTFAEFVPVLTGTTTFSPATASTGAASLPLVAGPAQ